MTEHSTGDGQGEAAGRSPYNVPRLISLGWKVCHVCGESGEDAPGADGGCPFCNGSGEIEETIWADEEDYERE